MMVIVLSVKGHRVDHPHGNVRSRVHGQAGKIRGVQRLRPCHELLGKQAKARQDLAGVAGVVIRLVVF